MFFKNKIIVDKVYMGCGDDYKDGYTGCDNEGQKPLKLFARLGNYQNIAKMSAKYIQGIWWNI